MLFIAKITKLFFIFTFVMKLEVRFKKLTKHDRKQQK